MCVIQRIMSFNEVQHLKYFTFIIFYVFFFYCSTINIPIHINFVIWLRARFALTSLPDSYGLQ